MYKRGNGCQVLLLLVRWEMRSEFSAAGSQCVIIFLIILIIQHLNV